jgi:hypothetical protein
MATINVYQSVIPSVTAMSLIGLIRSDTNAPPVGVSLPISMAFSGGFWTCSFTDTAPPASYTGTFTLTIGALTYPPFSDTISGGGGAVGMYTTQALIEQTGQLDADIWSNIGNASTGPNQPRYQSAINSVESIMNGRFVDEFYSVPIPPGPVNTPLYFQFQRISEVATKLALTELYFAPRGIREGSNEIGGQLKVLRQWAYDELDRILSRPVLGVTRNLSAPQCLVASDWFGNPLPYITNAVIPEYGGYPGWFFGGAGPWGLW